MKPRTGPRAVLAFLLLTTALPLCFAEEGTGRGEAPAGTTVADGEVTHGTNALLDLAALPGPVADEDVFRISQKPRTSYEVVVDGNSGDIDWPPILGPFLERVASDGSTVLQSSVLIGTGSNRSLRWTTGPTENNGEFIRVRSGSCGTTCGPDDVYRLRVYETSYSAGRFNNNNGQVTFLILHNPTNYELDAQVDFYSQFGGHFTGTGHLLAPKATWVLDTRTIAAVENASGSMTIAHNGRYGDLVGKAMTVEPSTGFSFDTVLEPRPK